MGGWPLIDPKWKESDFDIESAIIETIKLRFTSSFINIKVINDMKNTSNHIISVNNQIFKFFVLNSIF